MTFEKAMQELERIMAKNADVLKRLKWGDKSVMIFQRALED